MQNSIAFLEQTVKALVENKDAVKVESKADEMGILLTLSVAANDMGMVIGRMGNTAKAIRYLLNVVGRKEQAKVSLKIAEPEGSTYQPKRLWSSAKEELGL